VDATDHTYWFLTRSSGLVAYLLLFATCTLGLTLTGGVLERWLRRFRVYDLHRFLSLLTLAVTVFHVFIILGDGWFSFSVAELLIPFASPYRPLWTALGGLSLYLMVITIGAFYLRPLVPYRAWRLLHYLTFVAFVAACAHGVGAGTDTEAEGFQYVYAVTGLVVFNMLVYRWLRGGSRGVEPRTAPRASRETAPVTRSRQAAPDL
jgi:predicted ferric reductase